MTFRNLCGEDGKLIHSSTGAPIRALGPILGAACPTLPSQRVASGDFCGGEMVWGADLRMKGVWPGLPPQCLLPAPQPSTCQGHRSSQVAALRPAASLPRSIPLPSVLSPSPPPCSTQTPQGRRRGDICPFQAAQNTHTHTHTQRCPPSSPDAGGAAEPGTARSSHLPSPQEAPPGARTHSWMPRECLGEHPGMWPP